MTLYEDLPSDAHRRRIVEAPRAPDSIASSAAMPRG